MNKTKIFINKSHFDQRPDRSVNGVSREFAMMYPHWLEQNTHNTACWECVECQDCYRCVGCVNCWRCNTSENCINCNSCVGLYGKKNRAELINFAMIHETPPRNKINETI